MNNITHIPGTKPVIHMIIGQEDATEEDDKVTEPSIEADAQPTSAEEVPMLHSEKPIATIRVLVVTDHDSNLNEQFIEQVFLKELPEASFNPENLTKYDLVRSVSKKFSNRLRMCIPYLPLGLDVPEEGKNNPLRTVRDEIRKLRGLVSELEKREQALIDRRKANCPHPEDRIKIVPQSYMEEGRMRSPIEWNEKVCGRCGKVLARSSQSVVETWETVDD